MNVQTLSAAKLLAAIDKADKVSREFCDAFITAGRGHETMADIRASAKNGFDPLAIAYCKALDAERELNSEKESRLRCHGKLNPIRKAA